MSDEELKAELERLRNENSALKKGGSSGIRVKERARDRMLTVAGLGQG